MKAVVYQEPLMFGFEGVGARRAAAFEVQEFPRPGPRPPHQLNKGALSPAGPGATGRVQKQRGPHRLRCDPFPKLLGRLLQGKLCKRHHPYGQFQSIVRGPLLPEGAVAGSVQCHQGHRRRRQSQLLCGLGGNAPCCLGLSSRVGGGPTAMARPGHGHHLKPPRRQQPDSGVGRPAVIGPRKAVHV